MKRILFFLFVSISAMAAQAQISASDARLFTQRQFTAINNGIALAIKPLANTNKGLSDALSKMKKDSTDNAKLIKKMSDSLNATRVFAKQLNDSININRYRDSVTIVILKKLIDDRSAVLSLADFLTVNGITSLNMQAIIERIKANLKLPL